MASEQQKAELTKMFVVYGAGVVALLIALYLFGGDVLSSAIGFVFAFITIGFFGAASRMAKRIKKEAIPK